MHNREGEIEVIGQNQVEIKLKRRPSYVKVHFKDDKCIVPCDASIDQLEWQIVERGSFFGHDYYLQITYSVSDYRSIFWKVEY